MYRQWTFIVFFVGLLGPAAAPGQSVIGPPDSYVPFSTGGDPVATPWKLDGSRRVLTVAFQDPPPGRPEFWRPAREALSAWASVEGVPIGFSEAAAGRPADVEFGWIPGFTSAKAGVTRRQLSGEGHVERAYVTLARDHANGLAMSPSFVGMVALHEIGHVLGLPHSESPGDAMYPGSRNMSVSRRDRESLLNLYGLGTGGGPR